MILKTPSRGIPWRKLFTSWRSLLRKTAGGLQPQIVIKTNAEILPNTDCSGLVENIFLVF